MTDLNIPDDVIEEAFGKAWMVAPGKQPEWQRYSAGVIARWAREEALKEAEEAVSALLADVAIYTTPAIVGVIQALAKVQALGGDRV